MIIKLLRNNRINKYCINYLLNNLRNSFCSHYHHHQIKKCSFSTQIKSQNTQINSIFNFKKIQKYLLKIENDYSNGLSENKIKNFDESNLLSKQYDLINKRKELIEIMNELEEMKKDKKLCETATKDWEECLRDLHQIEDVLIHLLIPEDPLDKTNEVILEISPGVGGREAMLFASDLWEMYQGFSDYHGWRFDILNFAPSEEGGMRHGSVSIEGINAFRTLRYEGGVHRVQRVPATERSGRVHTSTVTVACLPQAPDNIDLQIEDKYLKIETRRSSGAGGQHVNKTDSAIRIFHLPTGIQVDCQEDRSQHRNRRIALKKLKTILYSKHLQAIDRDVKDRRQMQVGQGDRSEKIRTYNFNQDRITDHRLGENFHNVDVFLKGGEPLDKLIEQLQKHRSNFTLEQWINSLE